MKIKILELEKHRNETTFRPYILPETLEAFKKVGIQIGDWPDPDMYWVGQASVVDKTIPIDESVQMGVDFCNTLDRPFLIFDGQDSHSLMGVAELFGRLRDIGDDMCMGIMKNSMLKDIWMYNDEYSCGRYYWGKEGDLYKVPNLHQIKDSIFLSGTNWLSTCKANFMSYIDNNKPIDVFGYFSYPMTQGVEHGVEHYKHYNRHRKPCYDTLRELKSTYNVALIEDGKKLSQQGYYEMMWQSKIVISPFGYGEMTPRDLNALDMGAVLIKPTVNYLKSEPWIHDEGSMYISCRHDYADLPDKIEFVLSNFKTLRAELVEYGRSKFHTTVANPMRIATHVYNIFADQLEDYIEYE